ncbi:MAG: hypothetical protein K6G56_01930 [Clostridiales bacterium]|nr:hypothetical protein [Clostridiales bacterium]
MKKPLKWILIAALAAAAAALAVGLLLDVNAKKLSYKPYEHSITYFYADREGSTRFFVDSALLENKIAGRVDEFISCDGAVGAARAGTGLYRIDKDGVILVHPAGVQNALISLDGNVIVFTTATEVHIYDHRTGKVEDIKPDSAMSIASIVVSPDGKTVGYTVKNADGGLYAYAHENGESRKIANDALIMAVGDGAKFFYYVTPDDVALFYATPERARKLGTGVSSLLEFNRDLTEVTFDMNGVTYYSVKGSRAKTLVEGASVFSTVAECGSSQGGSGLTAQVKDASTLFNAVFYSFKNSSSDTEARTIYDLYYVNGHKNVTALARGAYQFALSGDRKTLSCLMGNELYAMDSDDPKTAEKVCSNVYSYSMDKGGRIFYCIGGDLGFYYAERGGQTLKMAERAVFTRMTGSGGCLFLTDYDKTGALHLANGKQPIKDIAANVAHVETMPKVSFYYTDVYEDEFGAKVYDVYYSENGVDFVLGLEAARMDQSEE